jgi:hypothetical protein
MSFYVTSRIDITASSELAVLLATKTPCTFAKTTFWSPPTTTKDEPAGIGAFFIRCVFDPLFV